jgi:hypothetical protein
MVLLQCAAKPTGSRNRSLMKKMTVAAAIPETFPPLPPRGPAYYLAPP